MTPPRSQPDHPIVRIAKRLSWVAVALFVVAVFVVGAAAVVALF